MSQSSDSRLGSLAHWLTFRESRLTAQFFGLPAYFLGLLDLSLGSLARKSWLTGLRVSDSVTASRDGFVAHWIRVETYVFRLTLNYLLIGLQNRSSAHRQHYQIKKFLRRGTGTNETPKLIQQWMSKIERQFGRHVVRWLFFGLYVSGIRGSESQNTASIVFKTAITDKQNYNEHTIQTTR